MYLISTLDWIIIVLYLIGLIVMAYVLSRSQFNREDYYLGHRSIGSWPIAVSIMATQCSTNSILGAPAFVAFASGGGLVWLQYELAVPLAMIPLMLIFLPLFAHLRLVTVYEYLERRFCVTTRCVLSGLFMLIRAFATSVTVYSIALVIDLITDIGFFGSVVLLGVFTVIYDVMGGIKGVIYSDVIQMIILVGVLLVVAALLVNDAGGFFALFDNFPASRRAAIDFKHHGLGDNHTFSFWPMLLGGFFLYVSYYGCDQSQVQRELSAKTPDTGNMALLLNGLLRFPLVALYCLVGVGIAVYASSHPNFLTRLPIDAGQPNVNLAVPIFMLQQLPPGLVGLGLVALLAAAMSSLDSVLNSLSATTMEDFVRRFAHWSLTGTQELWLSRLMTALWGVLTLTLAFFVGDIAPTVLETINKIGSLINGPILGVFAVGIFTRIGSSNGVIIGLISGFIGNILLWHFAPEVSWLWWNVFGFIFTFVSAMLISALATSTPSPAAATVWSYQAYGNFGLHRNWPLIAFVLMLWFALLLVLLTTL